MGGMDWELWFAVLPSGRCHLGAVCIPLGIQSGWCRPKTPTQAAYLNWTLEFIKYCLIWFAPLPHGMSVSHMFLDPVTAPLLYLIWTYLSCICCGLYTWSLCLSGFAISSLSAYYLLITWSSVHRFLLITRLPVDSSVPVYPFGSLCLNGFASPLCTQSMTACSW